MTEHNAWSRGPDSQQDEDVEVEVETVEAERVMTMVEVARLPIAEQLAALNGGPVKPLTAQELQWLQRIAAWYASRCVEAGAPMPPDVLRSVTACANEVVSFNQHLAAQGHADAKPQETMQ